MFLAFFAFLQEHAPKAAEHAAEGAKKAGEHGATAAAHGGGHHTPWIVEQINHAFGSTMFAIQQNIMPPIYGLFGKHWPGEGMTPCIAPPSFLRLASAYRKGRKSAA